MLKGDDYRCAVCGGVFECCRSDAEANAEAEALFGVTQASARADMAVVCDDCWERHKADWIGMGGVHEERLKGRA